MDWALVKCSINNYGLQKNGQVNAQGLEQVGVSVSEIAMGYTLCC